MSQIKIKKFEKDNSVYFKCTFYNILGTKTDPDSPAYAVYDSSGAEIVSGTPEKSATGIYYFYHAFSTEGK